MALARPARLAVALLLVSCAAAARTVGAPRGGVEHGASTPRSAAVLTARPTTRTMYEAALRLPEVSEVVAKIDDAGLLDQFLKPNLKITAFVPTNEALARAEKYISYNSAILNDTKVVKQVLAYHLINRPLRAKDFEFGLNLQPTVLGGQPLKITKEEDGTMKIGPYKVIKSDVQAGKSVIHVIDGLLVAPSLVPTLVEADEKRKARAAAQASEERTAEGAAGAQSSAQSERPGRGVRGGRDRREEATEGAADGAHSSRRARAGSDKAPAKEPVVAPAAPEQPATAGPAAPKEPAAAAPAAPKEPAAPVAPEAPAAGVPAATVVPGAAPTVPVAPAAVPAAPVAPAAPAAPAKTGGVAVAAIDATSQLNSTPVDPAAEAAAEEEEAQDEQAH